MKIHLPVDIVFCHNLPEKIADVCSAQILNKICIATGQSSAQKSGLLERTTQKLDQAGIKYFISTISSEPESNAVDELAEKLQKNKTEAMVALGGGSVIDAAKSAALLVANSKRFSEVEFNTAGLENALKIIAAPTVSGSGSETTPYSVINNIQSGRKSTIFHPSLFPHTAIICPAEQQSVSARQTAAGAFDALIHCFEAYTSTKNCETVNAFAVRGAGLVFKNLQKTLDNPQDIAARKALAEASMLGGAAIAHVRTGAIHTLSVALQKYSPLPHGLLNAFIAPFAFELNGNHYSGSLDSFLQDSGFQLDFQTDAACQFSKWFAETHPVTEPALQIPAGAFDSIIERFKQDKGLLEVNPAPLSDKTIKAFISKVIHA